MVFGNDRISTVKCHFQKEKFIVLKIHKIHDRNIRILYLIYQYCENLLIFLGKRLWTLGNDYWSQVNKIDSPKVNMLCTNAYSHANKKNFNQM